MDFYAKFRQDIGQAGCLALLELSVLSSMSQFHYNSHYFEDSHLCSRIQQSVVSLFVQIMRQLLLTPRFVQYTVLERVESQAVFLSDVDVDERQICLRDFKAESRHV